MTYDHNKALAQRREEEQKIAAFGRQYWRIHNNADMSEGDKVAAKYQLQAAVKDANLSQNQIMQYVLNNQDSLERELQLEKMRLNPGYTQEQILQTLQDIASKLK